MTKILVIEDELPIRSKIETILEYEGYDVLGAGDGVEGVKLAQAEIPDLVICDVLMPEMNGYGALSALRSNADTAAIPVIFLTAAASRADMRKGMELGADGVLLNTGIAGADDPVKMAVAMKYAIQAGQLGRQAGRIPRKLYATASSPLEGVIGVKE